MSRLDLSHIVTHLATPEPGRTIGERTSLCGETSIIMRAAHDPARATCSKCAELHFSKLVPANVRLETFPQPGNWPDYRSAYALHVDGVHVAFVCCKQGWGKGWSVRGIRNHATTGAIAIGFELGDVDDARTKSHAILAACAFLITGRLAPAIAPADYLAAEKADAARQASERERKRLASIAAADAEIVEIDGQIAAAGAHKAALRAINVESATAADAIAWALEIATTAETRLAEKRAATAERLAKHHAGTRL